MARRKSHKKTSHKKRRSSRMGAVGTSLKSTLMDTVYLVGGAIAGKYVSSFVKSQAESISSLSSYSGYIGAASPILVSALLPKVIKKKSPAIDGLRKGMLVAGGLDLATSLGVISGLPSYYVPTVGALSQNTDVRSEYVPTVGAVNMDMAGCGYGY